MLLLFSYDAKINKIIITRLLLLVTAEKTGLSYFEGIFEMRIIEH